MGSGKGSPEWWVANIKPGRVMFEMSYPNEEIAREALRRAMHKLPCKCRIVTRGAVLMATTSPAAELRELTDEELVTKLREAKEELFKTFASRWQPASWTQTAAAHGPSRDCAHLHRPA